MGRHLVCSDLHGIYGLWEQIKADLQPDDTLYFLGDAIDRGPDGWKILKEMLTDSRVQMICGNHEDMMIDALINNEFNLWFYNGGKVTYRSMMDDDIDIAVDIFTQVKNLPTILTYINPNGKLFCLSHAGFTPDGGSITALPRKDLIWDRSHFFAPWPDGMEDIYIIHGHTPIPYLIEDLEQYAHFSGEGELEFVWEDEASPWRYCNGHKIDIDCLSIVTGNTIVFDMDTEEYKAYYGEGVYKRD